MTEHITIKGALPDVFIVQDARTRLPIAGLVVSVQSPSGAVTKFRKTTQTDELGRVDLGSLVPQEYTVTFRGNRYEETVAFVPDEAEAVIEGDERRWLFAIQESERDGLYVTVQDSPGVPLRKIPASLYELQLGQNPDAAAPTATQGTQLIQFHTDTHGEIFIRRRFLGENRHLRADGTSYEVAYSLVVNEENASGWNSSYSSARYPLREFKEARSLTVTLDRTTP